MSRWEQSVDVELAGHGSLGLTWEEWRTCYNLAKAFGWKPAGTLGPEDRTHWGGQAGINPEFDMGYFSKNSQRVTDADAKAFAQALQTAMSTWNAGQELTLEQHRAFMGVPKHFDSYVVRVAEHAARSGFLIL